MLELHRNNTTVGDIHFGEPPSPDLGRPELLWPHVTVVAMNSMTPKSAFKFAHELSHRLMLESQDRSHIASDLVHRAMTLQADNAEDIYEYFRNDFPELFQLNEELAEVAAVEKGWHDPDSPAPSLLALRFARNVAFALDADDLPLPHAFPTPEGGISLEWTLGPIEASLTIEQLAAAVTFSAWNSLTDEHDYRPGVDASLVEIRDWVDKLTSNR